MSKDFFGEEFEKQKAKQEQENSNANNSFEQWQRYSQQNSNLPDNGGATSKSNKTLTIALIALSLVLVFILGFVCAMFFNNTSAEQKLIKNVLKTIQDKYYTEITEEQLVQILEAGGSAMLQQLDPYSTLYSPQAAYDYLYGNNNSSSTQGSSQFGISFGFVQGVGLLVYDVAPDSASIGKLQKSDLIVALNNPKNSQGNPIKSKDGQTINSLNLADLTLEEIKYYMGIINTAEFVVMRNAEIIKVELKADIIGYYSKGYKYVEYYVNTGNGVECNVSTVSDSGEYSTESIRGLNTLEQGIGYVRLKQFDRVVNEQNEVLQSSAQELQKVLQMFKDKGVKNIILDLKGNPGGYVDECQSIVGMLAHTGNLTEQKIKDNQIMKNGQMLVTKLYGRNDKQLSEYYVTSSYTDYFANDGKVHIVVFTDGGSASASEMLLGALLNYGTAVHMGSTSYGKGIAQVAELLPITGNIMKSDGTSGTFNWMIYYTNAKYYTPLHNNIHGVGYTPDNKYYSENYTELIGMVNQLF